MYPEKQKMKILAIDPGSEQSAYVIWDGKKILHKGIEENDAILWAVIHPTGFRANTKEYDSLAIEMIASYGMPVGKSVFDTCVWIGRFIERWEHYRLLYGTDTNDKETTHRLIYRKDVKMHICKSMRAKDSNIRQALIDRFGKPGTKKSPGLLYGVKKDEWSALAIAVYQYDIMNKI